MSITEKSRRLTLWYAQPATAWNEALPLGNGRLGAMVFGGVEQEHLQLNEDTLWSGGPHCYDNPEAYGHLAGAREALDQGAYDRAQAIAENMLGKPKYQQAYVPLGDMYLNFAHDGDISDYRRSLDMANAVSEVTYRVGDAHFTRTVIASRPDETIVIRLECDKPGQVAFDLSLTSPHPSESRALEDGTLSLTGHIGSREESPLIGPWDGEGMRFAARANVIAEGGMVVAGDTKIVVEGADAVTICYVAATSYVNYQDISGDPVARVDMYLFSLKGVSWEQLYKAHVDDYSTLFDRVSLDLGGEDDNALPTDERLRRLSEGDTDPLLVEQFFQYGRYLMIAGSRPGTQPLNLQGIWNDQVRAMWGSKYTININIQMNYWVAEVCNLSECHEPLLRMVGELQAPGAKTAQTHYQAGGWLAHHNTDLWRGTAPVDGAEWGMWQGGGAWLCQHLWEHFLYTEDIEFLEHAYPILKGAAEFFMDFLIENEDGYLVTSPSLSPEHSHGGMSTDGKSQGREGYNVCAAPTIDMELLRDLFTNCIESAKILDVDKDFCEKLTDTRGRLAPLQIGKHGQLQEWYVDWDNPDDAHSHVSHLYGLYPSYQINPHDAPELFAAARTSLVHRGMAGGWPGAWRISLWARCGEGEQAREALVKHVMRRLTDNLFNGSRVFQIDANFGATAGIAEMLLQSHGGVIQLLPALPKAWVKGNVTGLRARGGYAVDMQWENGALTKASIRADRDGTCLLRTDVPVKICCGDMLVDTEIHESGLVAFPVEHTRKYVILSEAC